ncbi:3-oxoacyl-[acyl-carrier-protein] reductase FabG-like [Periplaneta americana]|uniref:3-oxoacyl-[acyl-carrier-protein] reductase FabG-like n=1 Tax=Periplaneta americana TaxID=6978 RepID=UPI0037E80505
MKDLKDKVVVVTGSTRGIGKEVAKAFLACGSKVVVSGSKEDITQSTAQELSGFGTVFGVTCNVKEHEDAKNLIAKTVEKFGKIDVLVNNAGITKDNLFIRMSEQDWDDVISINLKGVYNCAQAAISVMMKQRYGNIINMASIIGIRGNAGQANYSASKGAVIALTKTLAREYAQRNIRVNAIAPGFIDTDMTQAIPENIRTEMIKQIPLQKLGTPEDIANTALFLASDMSRFITAQAIVVDGGMI